ncbi:hypothetical protein D3C72_2427960 [compost metagenome]
MFKIYFVIGCNAEGVITTVLSLFSKVGVNAAVFPAASVKVMFPLTEDKLIAEEKVILTTGVLFKP